MNEEQVKELTEIIARLFAMLQYKDVFTKKEVDFICGLISEEKFFNREE